MRLPDSIDALHARGVEVLGISPDKPEKLAKFRERDGLTITLLSDPDRHVHEAYGAYGEKKLYGKTVQGVIRSTFVVDEEGRSRTRGTTSRPPATWPSCARTSVCRVAPTSHPHRRREQGAQAMSSSTPAVPAPPSPQVAALEAELAERRAHLSTTIDELVTRLSPKEILRREVESVKIKVVETTRTPDGQLRTELVASVLGAVSVVLLGAGLLRRSRG